MWKILREFIHIRQILLENLPKAKKFKGRYSHKTLFENNFSTLLSNYLIKSF